MFNTAAGIVLMLAVGMCFVAFPFVLWMLFGVGPRSLHKRHTARPRGKALRVPAGATNRKKSPGRGMTRRTSKTPPKGRLGGRGKKGHALVEQSPDQRRGGQCDHPGDNYTS